MEQEELTKLCNQAKDKGYIKFLTDEGWKCENEADAQIRYGRLRKAISYVDGGGNLRRFALVQSGYDGSVLLEEADPNETQFVLPGVASGQ